VRVTNFYALITGALIADPVTRKTQDGRDYVTVSLRCGEGNKAAILSAAGFSEHATSLLRFTKGDAVSIAGPARLTEWTAPDGAIRHGVTVTAQQIASTRPERRPRAAPTAHERRPKRRKLSLPRPQANTEQLPDDVSATCTRQVRREPQAEGPGRLLTP
jgi:single-stranded DNA-binding protein